MRKIISLLFFGFFLSGCYTSSLTMVGPATGVASGKFSETAVSSSLNYVVKKQTGKTPIEHVLSESQVKVYQEKKSKVNPCNKNKKLCSIVSNRVDDMQKKLLGLNLQARIEKKRESLFIQKNKD